MLDSDVLTVGARDQRALPLADRRAILARLLPAPGILRATDTFDDPAPLVAFCTEWALPGVLSRRKDSPYKGGHKPSAAWLKTTVTDAEPIRHSDAPPPPPSRQVPVTNRHKVFWPDEGYTKGDLVDYYEAIAPAILPYLRDRPIAVVRYPDGIAGKNFYQWNVPPGMPRWVSSFELRDEEAERGEKRVFLVNDVPSLVYIANLACLPLHMLACRAQALQDCDFLTIDFDVRLSTLARAVEQARALERILGEIGLVGYPKTSGQSGLHVLVPLGPGASFATARALADLLGRMLVDLYPEHATMERVVKKRGAKVYVDTGQTGPTRMIVSPYSVRAYPGATVSTPLGWDEVVPELEPARFTIKTVPDRFAELGDAMRPLLRAKPDVPAAVKKLEGLIKESPLE
jgi:bifunctional non-homologous end joining protein LigD